MWRNRIIGLVLIIFIAGFLMAESNKIQIKINKTVKILTEEEFLKQSKETFEMKGEKSAFLDFFTLSRLYKIKKCSFAELQSIEGMRVSISYKEFSKAGLVLVKDGKESYFRVVIKDDSFHNRWLKYIEKIEFK